MAKSRKESKDGFIRRVFRRYFIDAMSAMALGLFASLIIATILNQLGRIPGLSVLSDLAATVTGAGSVVTGAAIGVAVAWGLGHKPLVVFSSVAVGAIAYAAGGGPIGAYAAAVVGAEIGGLIAGRTKLDIVLSPLLTIVPGGLVGLFIGPYLNQFMTAFGEFVNTTTEWAPLPMGIAVAVIVGMALTAPISSAALCVSIGISGLAAGAAAVGCSAQMIGFAVASFRDNGLGGLLSQGIGTSMLQFGNIMRRPQIWIAPTLAGAVLGPISTCVFKMTNTAVGAGMGTSGLVGQFGAIEAMSGSVSPVLLAVEIILMHVVLPAILTLLFDFVLRKAGWIKAGDMAIHKD